MSSVRCPVLSLLLLAVGRLQAKVEDMKPQALGACSNSTRIRDLFWTDLRLYTVAAAIT